MRTGNWKGYEILSLPGQSNLLFGQSRTGINDFGLRAIRQMLLNKGQLNGVRILGPKTVDLMTTNSIGDLFIFNPFKHNGIMGINLATDLAFVPNAVFMTNWNR